MKPKLPGTSRSQTVMPHHRGASTHVSLVENRLFDGDMPLPQSSVWYRILLTLKRFFWS